MMRDINTDYTHNSLVVSKEPQEGNVYVRDYLARRVYYLASCVRMERPQPFKLPPYNYTRSGPNGAYFTTDTVKFISLRSSRCKLVLTEHGAETNASHRAAYLRRS